MLITKKDTSLNGLAVVLLIDCPLRTFHKVMEGDTTLETYTGTVFEEIIRSLCAIRPTEKVIDWKWAESCTEIDVLFVDESQQTVYWGFCKRNGSQHHLLKNMCHILSFFNNRGWTSHQWYTFDHQMVLYSPTFSDRDEQIFEKNYAEQVIRFSQEGSSEIVKYCQNLLSNVFEKGKNFVPKDMPEHCTLRFKDRLLIVSLEEVLKQL